MREISDPRLCALEEVADRVNVAFKCTYNDGGQGPYVGFCGTCSDSIIAWNVEQGRVWCSQKECWCREYYDDGFTGGRPEDPCYESVLFSEWRFAIGIYHTGPRAGDPMTIRHAGIGDIAIFTTRFPGDSELDRKIVGLFRIGDIYDDYVTYVQGEEGTGIRLPLDVAKNLYFWDYYSNPSSHLVSWGSGLFRYLTDEQTFQVLRDIYNVARDEHTKSATRRLFPDKLEEVLSGLPPASGARIRLGGKPIIQRVAHERKYGSTGEGENHKRLKEWVAGNPGFLGLKSVTNIEVDSHVFPPGDTPDIVFTCNGRIAVVEIETECPMPGAYQALKYKTLVCAERGLDIQSSAVTSFLVAWVIPEDVKRFCDRYGIQTKVKRL